MLFSYFAVSCDSGNILHITLRSSPPTDTATVHYHYASLFNISQYHALHNAGQDLINLRHVS
ncbi:hypothetical protein [Pseudomonas aeruginosa]|uniref:hypothetical protein n=1 Tax=Pseudomonas aeruginosa TaxID=287 RepID=UPI001F4BC72E|nr:hypothetical protein [Pseudomonas aeruginosa]HEK0085355.1 hypothetical protein [Pseudomonas aeruginosa]HEK0091532.1 hypothetical protein [Pseudomonas aeruginosa]HEK1459432.1 hypothetical protein [Pseudomonas aeruginosa]